MQLGKIKPDHLDYLKRTFHMDEVHFFALCRDDGPELEELLDALTWKECDAAEELARNGAYSADGLCAIELIDIICGPYDGDAIRARVEK